MNRNQRDEPVTDRPLPGRIYSLTGGPGVPCIANGDSWRESDLGDADEFHANERAKVLARRAEKDARRHIREEGI